VFFNDLAGSLGSVSGSYGKSTEKRVCSIAHKKERQPSPAPRLPDAPPLVQQPVIIARPRQQVVIIPADSARLTLASSPQVSPGQGPRVQPQRAPPRQHNARKAVRGLVDAGELSPSEADERFEQVLRLSKMAEKEL